MLEAHVITNSRKSNYKICQDKYRVPTRTGKPGNIRKAFSGQGILNRPEKSRKITQNTGKVRNF